MFIKICGITSDKDIEYVNKSGADFAGMVLYFPKSKRNISIMRAAKLKKLLTEDIKAVAVTVSPDLNQVISIRDAGFSYIQIHGELSKEVIDFIKNSGNADVEMPDTRKINLVRAYNQVGSVELKEIEMLREMDRTYAFLFDAKEPGSGSRFDWNNIPDRNILKKPYFLSGGLTPDSVAEAITEVNPDGVDVSSGVELSDADARTLAGFIGISSLTDELLYGENHTRQSDVSMKDFDKIKTFVKNARECGG